MATTDVIEQEFTKWVATRQDEAVISQREGYYPFSVIADAFEHGVEKGEAIFKGKLRETFYDNMKKANDGLSNMLDELSKNDIFAKKVFINHSVYHSVIIFTIEPQKYLSRDFIDKIYPISADIENKFSTEDFELNLSFMVDDTNLNIGLLKSDGFGFGFDLEEKKSI